jgi:glycosyltransferase involved in cell wall biosynthesis
MRICEQVADGLFARGHDVAVLTSTYQDGPELKPYPITRALAIEPDWQLPSSPAKQFFIGRRQREMEAITVLEETVGAYQPDIIFIWDAFGLSKLMLRRAERMITSQTVYYFANYLPEFPGGYVEYWSSSYSSLAAKILKYPFGVLARWMLRREGKPVQLAYEHTISVSHYVRDRLQRQGLIGTDAIVAPNAIDVELFARPLPRSEIKPPLRCVLAGRIAPEKGVETAVHAFGLLKQQGYLDELTLTIIGDGTSAYKNHLKHLVVEYGVESAVSFRPAVPIAAMPEVLAEHHILLLPSEWDEPLSCSMLEAMAAGLLVVGTTRGGSGEVLQNGRTGITFQDGNAADLATQLQKLLQRPEKIKTIIMEGQQEVLEKYNMEVSISRIETYLQDLVVRTAAFSKEN